ASRRIDRRKLFRTVIEVIDPVTHRVVVSGSRDAFIVGALPGRRVATYVEDENGVPKVEIIAFSISR
ncbi:MAG: hypothetical protein ACREMA_14100, partial [Longimicrobiales bacterium]